MAHIAIDARIIRSSTGRYVERLVHYLEEIDHDNQYTILVREKDKDYWQPTQPNFTTVVADFDDYSLAEQFGFWRFLNKLGPDVVHFCMPQQPILYRGNKLTTFHDLTLLKTWNSDKNWLIYHVKQLVGRFVFRRVARTSDHIIAISQFTKNELIEFAHIPEEKVSVIYEASDIDLGSSRKYELPFTNYLLYVGQQSDYKNIRRLGEAHQRLLETQPELGLVLVGKKNESALANEAFFEKQGYRNIHFTDFIEDDQLNWLYQHAAAYVFPSLMEGFGLPGLEAMGHGTPVVSSNATCLPEVYGDAAYYFNPKDSHDIARAIAKVLSDEALRRELTTKGYEQVKKYSWKKMALQTHSTYMAILKNSPEQS